MYMICQQTPKTHTNKLMNNVLEWTVGSVNHMDLLFHFYFKMVFQEVLFEFDLRNFILFQNVFNKRNKNNYYTSR